MTSSPDGSPLVLCAGSAVRHSFSDMADAAAVAGFDGVTVWKRTVRRAVERESLDLRAMRSLLDDRLLLVSEVEGTAAWLPGCEPAAPDELGFGEGLEIAEALDARNVVLHAMGFEGERDQIVESFAQACDRAADHDVRLAIEFLPWTVIPSLEVALGIVQEAGRPNGCIVFDTWHHARSGGGALPADLPAELIGCVQVSDGPATPAEPDVVRETMHLRQLPGAGEFGVGATLGQLAELGVACPVGVEVYNAELGELGAPELATALMEAVRSVMPS